MQEKLRNFVPRIESKMSFVKTTNYPGFCGINRFLINNLHSANHGYLSLLKFEFQDISQI